MADFLKRKKKPSKSKIIHYAQVQDTQGSQEDAHDDQAYALPDNEDTEDYQGNSLTTSHLTLQHYSLNQTTATNASLFQEVAIHGAAANDPSQVRVESDAWPDER